MGLQPFEQVVAEHGAAVLRVCRATLGPHDADDAWSETFLAALRAYPDLPVGSNVRGWLLTIAHHKVIDAHRARSRRAVPTDVLPDQAGPEPPETDPELWGRWRRLPLMQRAAVAYHHIGGLPYAEIAELLGNSETAARRAAADGIRTLRRTQPAQPVEGDLS